MILEKSFFGGGKELVKNMRILTIGFSVYLLSKELREKWENYVWQSAAAGISIFLILYIFVDVINLILLAAAGSSAFTVFALPNNRTAKIRNLNGSYIICVIVGLACSVFGNIWTSGGLAVGFAAFLMVITDTEHPPAAGAALYLSAEPTVKGAIFILIASVVFSVLRYLLSPWLKDLA
ncbi:hypothetical protein AKJ37_00105 [candidate division MSBL1 archaeon SCGC-AAA259I09]|uniref:HPP transmembrane region domain-containing protein n=3 Tax=candidate division MSBL1 TaxID=215777 RepID=A0A133UW34_9EURY|nr:hypothetical protein AKJ61_00485 [candidate division MSBL1 archaeon SCGC-AAA259B11]KXA98402.1 hypothetical protein AKJ37_00105 [candidate division MSBL1 archaeon SCGC-AAA259I09]KXB00367.1 hypothetical protein AKJ40_01375 [candidate division MSBL1 archaeon SCGC-AAA259M10]